MAGLILNEFIHNELLTDVFEHTSLQHYKYLQDTIEWKFNDMSFIHSVHCKYVMVIGNVSSWIRDIIEYRGTKLTTIQNMCNNEMLHNIFSHPNVELYMMYMEEEMYLNLMRNVLQRGQIKHDRTKVGTLSLFAKQLCFDLQNECLPLLTSKRVFFKGVLTELLWFLKGSTDTRELLEKNVHIWDGNSSRDYLDKRGLGNYKEGELGPVYGYQWRNWGGVYPSKEKGIDQINRIITSLKFGDVHNRRLILSAWNVSDLPKMALPPCHMCCQFYVSDIGLCCVLTQRSGDLFLGVPFNIASYAILTRMIAKCAGLNTHRLIINLGDVHVYKTHVKACEEQLLRECFEFPTLKINTNTKNIDEFQYEDFEIVNYKYGPSISAPMAV